LGHSAYKKYTQCIPIAPIVQVAKARNSYTNYRQTK